MAKAVYLIQSITGYGPHEGLGGYDDRARLLTDAGFIRCRSERGADGKYWEVWLGYDFMLKGEAAGGQQNVMRFLTKKVGPGTISVAVEKEHWGLGID